MTLSLLQICSLDAKGNPGFVAALRRALKTPDTPAKTVYWLGKLSAVCEKEFAEFQAVRTAKFRELGKAIEGTDDLAIPPENMQKFVDEITSLEREVDLGLPDGLKLKLPDSCTPEDWAALIALDLFEEPLA